MDGKLVYLCGEYPRATDTFIQREIAGLRNLGFNIETISIRKPELSEQGTEEQDKERRATYYLLPCSPFRLLYDHFSLLFSSPGRYFRGLWRAVSVRSSGMRALLYQLFYFAEAGLVAARMRRKDLRHIHNHAPDACGYVAMLAGLLGKRTYSMTLHGFGIFSQPQRWRLEEKIKHSLFTICVSYHGLSQAMLWSDKVFWDKIHVVHCGVDPKEKIIRKHSGQAKIILFVGRLDHVKGVPVLIEAFAILTERFQDLHLNIVGDGPSRIELETLVKQKELNRYVTFHGYKSQKELYTYYSESDMLVLTSFAEGIPLVLMEAMAYGVTVVAPWIAGIPELVEDDVNGMLTIPAHINSLVDKMNLLIKDAKRRNKYAEAACKKIEKEFNLNIEINKISKIMNYYLS